MGVDEGNLQVKYRSDVDVILEDCPITILLCVFKEKIGTRLVIY